MFKWISALLAVVCAVLAVCLFQAGQKARQMVTEKQNLAAALATAQRQQVQEREKSAILAKEIEALRPRQAAAAAATGAGKSAAVTAQPPARGTGTGLAEGKNTDFFGKINEMMKNPEMQDAMRAQQKTMLGMMYDALFKKLNLAPELLDQLKELLLDRQMAGLTAFGGGAGKTAGADIAAMYKQVDQTVEALLDDEQYKTYQDYQQTMGERLTLNQFSQQLAGKAMPLDDAQQEELVTLMLEERRKLNIGSPLEQQQALAGGMPSNEMMEKLIQQQEELQTRILARAGEVLSEAQQQELKAFLENQAKIQKLGLQFMKSFAGGEKK